MLGGLTHRALMPRITRAAVSISDLVNARHPSFSHRTDLEALQAAVDFAYDNGIPGVFAPGNWSIPKPLYLWGATHYYNSGSGYGIELIGSSKTGTIIEKNTNSGPGDGSAYTADNAVVLVARRDKDAAQAAYNAALKNVYLKGTGTGGVKCDHALFTRGPVARLNVQDAVLEAKTGFKALVAMWLSRFARCDLPCVNNGFLMTTTGTSNALENMFVTGVDTVGYELRGAYSHGKALAADGITGVCYKFAFANWAIDGLGSESTSATKVIEIPAGTTNTKVTIDNIYIQPQNNAAKKVFDIASGGLVVVNGGVIGSDSSPQALAGQFANVTTSVSTAHQEGLVLNDGVAILDTYAVASVGSILRGTTRFGTKTIPTGVATPLYTVINEEIGIFYAYHETNAGIRAVAILGIAGGNAGFAVLNSSSLTLTEAAGVVSVQHALGSDQVIKWRYQRFGDAIPVTL